MRPVRIELDHTERNQRIVAGTSVTVQASENVDADGSVSCGIPGRMIGDVAIVTDSASYLPADV